MFLFVMELAQNSEITKRFVAKIVVCSMMNFQRAGTLGYSPQYPVFASLICQSNISIA